MNSSQRALVVFSGGQDSTTCLYWALDKFDFVTALTFSYGQRHIIELESAKRIAELAKVEHEILEIGSVFEGLSSLTDKKQAIPKYKTESNQSLPSTFVPGRNILFLSLAGSRAYTANCGNIVLGVSQEDYAGYPDCRSPFISSMQDALCNGLDKRLTVHSPLMNLTKKETVELAINLPGCMEALSMSTTCYNGQVPPCAECNSCQLRARGFREAKVDDPLLLACSKEKEHVDAGH